jgi:histone-lysine N-methyltransferase SUV39H
MSFIVTKINHLSGRPGSDSSESSIEDSFWRNSPTPEAEDEGGEEGKEWTFKIVGEEVDAGGGVR